jgi:hypothetical protein
MGDRYRTDPDVEIRTSFPMATDPDRHAARAYYSFELLHSHLLKAIIAKFTPGQQALLDASVFGQSYVPASQLDFGAWPDITFVLQGDAGDVRLRVAARDYWQVNAGKVGAAAAAFTPGQAGLAILGLPLMNGYFTIFDGEADGGRGVIRFATIKR